MSEVNRPTPENILSITYQLLQNYLDPNSVDGQLPTLFVQFQEDSIVRSKVIYFNEMLPYLKMLKERADSLGKTLLCDPPSTYDKKIVINYGNPSGGSMFPQLVQLALPATNPCTKVPRIVYIDHAGDFIVGDVLYTDQALTIPVTGYVLVNNMNTDNIYNLNTLTGVVGVLNGNTCTFPPTPDGQPISVRVSNGGSPCAVAPTVYYINHSGTFVIGDTIYIDNFLNNPLTGNTLIVDPANGIIYGLNSLTGVVLAATGGTCTPIPAIPYISFTNRDMDIVELIDNTYQSNDVSNRGISDYILDTNADGRIYTKYVDVNSQQFPLWFSIIDNILPGSDEYLNAKAAIYRNGTNIFVIDNGGAAIDTGISVAVNDLWSIRRDGITGDFIAEKSIDAGANWTNVYNFIYNSTARHYIKIQTPVLGRTVNEVSYEGLKRRPILLCSWGESNAGDGFANNGFLTVIEAGIRAIKIYNTDTNFIDNLQIGVNNQLGHAGLDLTSHGISNGMANEYDSNRFAPTLIVLCPIAQGGSTIQEWEPTDAYYLTMKSRIEAVRALIVVSFGYEPTILFHASQGINNIILGTTPAAWKALMKTFIDDIRATIKYNVSFLITNFAAMAAPNTDYDVVIGEIVSEDERNRLIDTTGAELRDVNHFQYEGQKLIAGITADHIAEILKID